VTLAFLLKHWRDAAIVVAIGCAVWWWNAHNASERDKGMWRERYRVADSTIHIVTPERIRAETVFVHDAKRASEAIYHVQTIHDTVLTHLTDTLIVKEYIAKTDTALAACTELARDCQTFRAYATQEIAAWKSKAQAAPVATAKGHMLSNALWAGVGLLGGFVLGHK
jgi:hypothetical protein